MLFWTVVFLIIWLSLLTKGNNSLIFTKTKQSRLDDIERASQGLDISKPTTAQYQGCILTFFYFFLFIYQFVYYFKAINIDMLRYPTIIMIVITIINILFFNINKSKKHDLTTEDGRYEARKEIEKLSKRSIKSILIQLINITYFCYMFYIQVLI